MSQISIMSTGWRVGTGVVGGQSERSAAILGHYCGRRHILPGRLGNIREWGVLTVDLVERAIQWGEKDRRTNSWTSQLGLWRGL